MTPEDRALMHAQDHVEDARADLRYVTYMQTAILIMIYGLFVATLYLGGISYFLTAPAFILCVHYTLDHLKSMRRAQRKLRDALYRKDQLLDDATVDAQHLLENETEN